MTVPRSSSGAPLHTSARLKYAVPGGTAPVYHASHAGEGAHLQLAGQFEQHTVPVQDARATLRERPGDLGLERSGFELVRHTSTVSDFYDPEQVQNVHEAEVAVLVARALGAARVVVFDHTRRAEAPAQRAARKVREPSTVVHNDYTDRSARQRIVDLLPDARRLVDQTFAIVNVWRAIGHPVETAPLALCDARSIAVQDLVPAERRAQDRVGEIYLARFNAAHRWYYYPRMQLDEALLIKTYDSRTDGRARFSIHSAFDDPAASAGAAPRESIESRVFAFFD